MQDLKVIWLPRVRLKLLEYRSLYFTPEDTLNYIGKIIKDTESLLGNSVLSMSHKEDAGIYKGIKRILIRNCRIYYEYNNDDVIVLGILFPGEK